MWLEVYINTIEKMDLPSLLEEQETLESMRTRLPYWEESKIEKHILIVEEKIHKLLNEQRNTVLH